MKFLLLSLLFLSGCHLDKLLYPQPKIPEKKCYWSAYYTRTVSGVTDTIWLGTQEIPCK